mgnify:CR=1 FL=1|tara:strand:+ start:169 stop:408 length:240 start_codon:yes stop_codon:yes gene_type:complete
MDIRVEKYKLVEWLIQEDNAEIIAKLKDFKNSLSGDSNRNYEISEIEKLFVEAGLKDIEEGNTFTNEEVIREINEKYGL